MKTRNFDIAIVGAGITGLSFACAAVKRGYRVILFEKNEQACSASVRNFGLIWPMGQSAGPGYERAMKSRELWLQLAMETGFWVSENGSLFVALHEDEMQVLEEYHKNFGSVTKILSPSEASNVSSHILKEKIRGALFSPHEMTINPPEAIQAITKWLKKNNNVEVRNGEIVYEAGNGIIRTSSGSWKADNIFICSGSVTHTLYSDVLKQQNLVSCKLQMMKFRPVGGTFNIGPTICGGLTLMHYDAFRHCPSIEKMKKRIFSEMPDYVRYGIHVLVAQNNHNELLIGDSHEYGIEIDPFIKTEINKLILKYLDQYFPIKNLELTNIWSGLYLKNPGNTEFVYRADSTTFLITGFGGGGMTLAPAFAEDFLTSLRAP